VDAQIVAIEEYIHQNNEKPPVWAAMTKDILANVKRDRRLLRKSWTIC
jgi:hypothetical protein